MEQTYGVFLVLVIDILKLLQRALNFFCVGKFNRKSFNFLGTFHSDQL